MSNGLGRGLRRIVAIGLVALAVAACDRSRPLEPGLAAEGRLEPGESVSYRIEAGAESYVQITIEPVGGENSEGLDARILDRGDQPLLDARGILDAAGGLLAWVTPSGGLHRLELSDPGSVEGVSYRVTLAELRPSRADDPDRAAARTIRAKVVRLYGAGDLEATTEALESELDSWRKVPGSVAEQSESLLDLAEIGRWTDPDLAMVRCEEAIRISTAAGLGEWRMKALNVKGRLLRARRDCAGALEAYRQAQEVALGEGNLSFAGNVSYNVGRTQLGCASRAEAERAFRKAIELGRRAADAGLQAVGHRELAILARASLDLTAAREHLDRAWELVEESDDRGAMADVLYERASLQRSLGRLGDARELFRRSLEINTELGRKELGREELSLRVLLSLGGLALDLRRPEDAREHYREALGRARAQNDLAAVADAERGLGAVDERSREPERAEELFRRSLGTAEQLDPSRERAVLVGAAKSRLGNLLLNQDRAEEALPHLRAALALQEEVGDPRAEAATRRAVGAALAATGDAEAAEGMFEDAIAAGRDLGDPISIAWTLFSQASTLAAMDPDRARPLVDQAIATLEQVRAGLSVDAFRADFSDGARRIYELDLELRMDSGDVRGAFLASERGRSRALLDLLAEARVDLRSDIDPELRVEARELDERLSWLRNELGEAVAAGAGDERTAALSRLLGEAEQDWWRVEAAIREASPRYRELRSPSAVEVETVQGSIPPGRALLEYWLGRDRAYVFVVTRGSFAAVPLGSSQGLVEQVSALRAAILGLHPPERLAVVAHRLYRDLLEPALDFTGGANDFIIVPDGSLHFLPFEALVTAAPTPGLGFGDLSYLGNRAVISYAPSAAVLASLELLRAEPDEADSRGVAPPRLVVFADPRHDRPLTLDCASARTETGVAGAGPRARSLGPLEASRVEARAIARRYGDRAQVYQGAEATEARVKNSVALASAERLHFAVHGVICEAFPERSGLVLALDDDPTEDGLLQVREIFGLRLGAEMVVLSACDSGTGKLISGEGVMGLARAFFYAGAPTAVVSLWPVSDRSTADLMASFYAHLDAGDDASRALQRARLELIEATGQHSAPFYWAPFVVLGSR